MKWTSALLLVGAVCPLFVGDRANALDIPIEVQELLPTNVSPRARPTQVVRVGVPLPADEHIQNVSELGFSGSSAAQFRVLQRDPETQDIRWVLVRFLGHPAGSAYSVTRGSGDFGAALVASDSGNEISIDTGAAAFSIDKQSFRLFDSVHSGGLTYVTNAGQGLVVDVAGTLYTSANDTNAEVVLEENGPLEAVVRASGHLTSATGSTYFGYTVRLYFNRDATSCRASVTLRNGELASLSTKAFDAAWIELPTALDANRQIRFGLPGADIVDSISSGSQAHLLQGDNNFMRNGRTIRVSSYLTSVEGLEVQVDGTTHVSTGNMADYAEGWMAVSDATRRVSIGMRDFAPQFPGGLSVDDDLLRVELFSSYNPLEDLLFSWGAHETREMLFDFGDPTDDPEDYFHALQYPLLGRCSREHYAASGAVYGLTDIVSIDEEKQFFAEQGKSWDLDDLSESNMEFLRQWSFSTTGGGNQFDKDFNALLDWVRAGYTGHFAQARQGVLWKADASVYHSDDFDYGDRQLAISDVDVSQPDTFHGKGAGSVFDDEHPHWVCMPLYYWLTGDERIRESIEDYVEYRRYRGGHPYYGAVKGGAIGHMRLWSRSFRDMALGYEVVQRQRYLDDLRVMAAALLDTIETNGSRGRNLERGYFYFGNEEDPDRRIHLFFLTEMNPIGVREAMRVLPSDDPLREGLRDYLAGLAWFTLREAQISDEAYGYPYGYYSAITNTELGNRGDQTGIVLSHGYRMSGDHRFAERARSFAWRVLVDANILRASDLSTHVRIAEWTNRMQHGVALLQPLATANPDGSWTLQWTVPNDATEYIVKYGERRMVENLNFDQVTRTFETPPDSAMNFWAANNMQGEPSPSAPLTLETWTTPVLPPGDWKFAVKVLLSSTAPSAPDTYADFGQMYEDGQIWLDLIANDIDFDGSIDENSLEITVPPASGSVEILLGTGEIEYTPAANFYGDEYFSYTIADNAGNRSVPTSVHIEVLPVNDAPVAVDDYFSADPNEALELPVLQNDTDIDSADLRIRALGAEAIAMGLVLDAERRMLHYVAPGKNNGPIVFQYFVEDEQGAADSAMAHVEMATVAVELHDMEAHHTPNGLLVRAVVETDEDIESFRCLRSRNDGPLEDIPGGTVELSNGQLQVLDVGTGLAAGDVLVYRFEARMLTGERRLLGAQVQIIYAPPSPAAYALEQSRPNPFNPMTTISFTLAKPAHTTLFIYDVMGRQVTQLVNQHMVPGVYSVTWDGTDLRGRRVASGTYYYRLVSGRFARTRSMRMVK